MMSGQHHQHEFVAKLSQRSSSSIQHQAAMAGEAAQSSGGGGRGWGAARKIVKAAHALSTRANTAAHLAQGVAIHVGGLEGQLEDEAALAMLFGRFGTVLAATLRVRHEGGKVSWALVSFASEAEAQAALDGTPALSAVHHGLVTRTVDQQQLAGSTGAMGNVMRTHVQARGRLLPGWWCTWWSVPVATIVLCFVGKARIPFGLAGFITMYATAHGERMYNKISALFA